MIAIVLAFAALPFGRPVALGAIRQSPAMKRALLSGLVLAGACVLVLSVSKQKRQLVVTWRPVLDRYHDEGTFVRDLVVARRFSVIHDNPRRCDGLLGKDALASCNERAERPRVATMYRSPYLYRCLDVQVGPGGTTWVRFRVDGDAIGFVRQAGGRQDLSIRLPGDERSQNIGRDRLHFRANAGELEGELLLEISNAGPAAQHACIAVAELSPD